MADIEMFSFFSNYVKPKNNRQIEDYYYITIINGHTISDFY